MFRTLFVLPALALVIPAQAEAGHPVLHHAVHDIREAIGEIEGARHEHFNRVKEAALRDLRIALKQVDEALVAVGEPFPKNFHVKPEIYRDYKDHRHLRHAEQSIREAIRELRFSEAFGDHRAHKERAIQALEAAHYHVEVLIKTMR